MNMISNLYKTTKLRIKESIRVIFRYAHHSKIVRIQIIIQFKDNSYECIP